LVKKKVEKPRREVTKRQLSRWQQQKRRQRIIFGLGTFIIVAVVGILGVGWFIGQYQPMRQTVIRVNDTEFNMEYYIEMLKLQGRNQSAEYMPYLANIVVQNIEQNELIKQGALKLGSSVSDEAVNKALKDSDLSINDALRDLTRTQMLINKLQDEYFEQQVPVFAEQKHIMAMLLESEQQANEVRARVEKGESFTEPAGELSLDALSKAKKGDLGWYPESILSESLGTSIPEGYAFSTEVGVLSLPLYDEETNKEVGYWLIKVLGRNEEGEEEEAYVLAMLLGSEEEAEDVRARLEAGEDFATLAEELSQYAESKEKGGDLGMVTPDMMTPVFDEFVFNPELELEMLSQPIRDEAVTTNGGYWLVKVVDEDDNRQIEDDDRDLLKAKALDAWVSSLLFDPENEIDDSYLDEEKKAWAIEQAM